MSVPLVVNGTTYQYPQQGDKNWAPTLTNWSTAVTSGMLQKAGGSFPLTAEVDFGASFGMKVLSIKSEESNIAASGILRLGNASSGIVWRNAANNADLPLTVNASNQLTFNGVNVGATTSLTSSHILVGNASNQPADVAMSGDITITNAGVTAIGAGKIVDAQINASAAIALTKLATLTASKLVVSNGSGNLTTQSSPTLTELGYVGGVTSAIQTQLSSITSSYLPLTGGTMSGALNMASNKVTSLASGTSASDAATYGQLKLLQTVTATGTTSTNVTAATFTNTVITATITPTSASNRILVTVSFTEVIPTAATQVQYTLNANGSDIVAAPGMWAKGNVGFSTTSSSSAYSYVHSPATTSAVTYMVRALNTAAGGTVIVGNGYVWSIILQEIV